MRSSVPKLKFVSPDVKGDVMKTSRDLFTTILAEVSGRDRAEITRMLDLFLSRHPSPMIDAPIPDEEYDDRLTALRAEKSGILNWLIAGAREARGTMP